MILNIVQSDRANIPCTPGSSLPNPPAFVAGLAASVALVLFTVPWAADGICRAVAPLLAAAIAH
jgi:hypothetical protein